MQPEDILQDLTDRQFLRPHLQIQAVLDGSSAKLGFCPRAAGHALRWLEINPERSVGRFRRTELTQLSRSIHRFWKHAIALETSETSK